MNNLKTMEEQASTREPQASVVFRNVSKMYFPETRVDCHYSVPPQHPWSTHDWIGLFKVGWSSLKDYHTYTWATVPEGRAAGAHVNCCSVFQAFYLPRPGPAHFQFIFVKEGGTVCTQSPPFTFCSPEPLDDLETVREERDEEEGDGDQEEEEMLLVIPKAQLLQSQLEDSLKGQQGMKDELESSRRDKDTETKRHDEERVQWEQEREAMQKEISELKEDLGQNQDQLRKMEGDHKGVQETEDSLSSQLSKLQLEKAQAERQIRELEEDVQVLSDCGRETDSALERMKERVRKVCDQLKYEEEKRKAVQAEHQAAVAAERGLQERLEASERAAEALRRELGELGQQRGNAHGELHQARLHAARLTLQLSEQELAHKEAQACWAQERDAYRQAAQVANGKVQQLSMEVQCREQWLQEERSEREDLEAELGRLKECHRVMLGDAKREAQELRAQLRTRQKERDPQHTEKQEVDDHVFRLEPSLGVSCHEAGFLGLGVSAKLQRPCEAHSPQDQDIAPISETQEEDLALEAEPERVLDLSEPIAY